MKTDLTPSRMLSLFLWLVMLHSLGVGIGLIFMPSSWMPFFGFEPYVKNFYQAQGGIFHIVLCVAYSMAAWDYKKYDGLIIFSFIAKFIAFGFLLLYYFIIDSSWMIIFSSIADGLMGLILLMLYKRVKRTE